MINFPCPGSVTKGGERCCPVTYCVPHSLCVLRTGFCFTKWGSKFCQVFYLGGNTSLIWNVQFSNITPHIVRTNKSSPMQSSKVLLHKSNICCICNHINNKGCLLLALHMGNLALQARHLEIFNHQSNRDSGNMHDVTLRPKLLHTTHYVQQNTSDILHTTGHDNNFVGTTKMAKWITMDDIEYYD